jgi:hypothetical protein
VGVTGKQIAAGFRKKFVTIGAAQPAQEAVSCSSLACARKAPSGDWMDACIIPAWIHA